MKWDYPVTKYVSRTAKASSLTLNSPGSWEEVFVHKNFFFKITFFSKNAETKMYRYAFTSSGASWKHFLTAAFENNPSPSSFQ